MKYHETTYQRLKREREEKNTVQYGKGISAVYLLLSIAIIALIIWALPNAIDQMFYEQYELPLQRSGSIGK